jgi:hypothetical protein
MTSFRRKFEEVMHMGVHLQVMKRRIWHLHLKEGTSPRKVPREGTSKKVKGRKT